MPKFMLGSVRHNLDDKNRMRIPAIYREGIGASPYILPSTRTGCLYIVPEEKFESIYMQLDSGDLFNDSEKNDKSTRVSYLSYCLKEDNQGRVTLSDAIANEIGIKKSDITKEIVFVGKGSYIELWSGEAWDARFKVLNPVAINDMLDSLKKRGN
ncbi:MAG: hypothetical protein RR338_05260 [Clostridia bacterium]